MVISLTLPFQSKDSCWGAQHLLFGILPNSSNFGPAPANTSFTWPSSEITPALQSFIITSSLTAYCPNSYVRPLTSRPQYFLSYFPFPSPKPQASATCNNYFLNVPHAFLSENSHSHTSCQESHSTHPCLCVSLKALLMGACSAELSSTLSVWSNVFCLKSTVFTPDIHCFHSEIIAKP